MNKIDHIQVELVDLIPDHLEKSILYLSNKYDTAIHLCACGCGNEVVTPFSENDGWHYILVRIPKPMFYDVGNKATWSDMLIKMEDGIDTENIDCNYYITINPSIYNSQFECKSHYFIEMNNVRWI